MVSRSGVGARIVPRSGVSVWQAVFTAASMAFLAVLSLGFASAVGDFAARWDSELRGQATIRLPASQSGSEDALRSILEATPGIARVNQLDASDQKALLEPWLGTQIQIDLLPLPLMLTIEEEPQGVDYAGLRFRLAGEFPEAVLDDHSVWREAVSDAAQWLRGITLTALGLIVATTALVLGLAAQAAMAANTQVIAVLREVGAYDAFIVRAFTGRFALRAAVGALVGTLAGLGVLFALPALPTGFGSVSLGRSWIWALTIPVIAALIAHLATRWAAQRALKGLS